MQKPKILFRNIQDVFPERRTTHAIRKEIDVLSFDAQSIQEQFKEPTYLDALFVLVVRAGEGNRHDLPPHQVWCTALQ